MKMQYNQCFIDLELPKYWDTMPHQSSSFQKHINAKRIKYIDLCHLFKPYKDLPSLHVDFWVGNYNASKNSAHYGVSNHPSKVRKLWSIWKKRKAGLDNIKMRMKPNTLYLLSVFVCIDEIIHTRIERLEIVSSNFEGNSKVIL